MRSTIPRLTASSANSRAVQWLTGRPHSSGRFSQANATIWHNCSAVNVAGAPDRGRSSSNSTILSVHTAAVQSPLSAAHPARAAKNRSRQRRARSRWQSSCRAIRELSNPSAAAKTTRARKATPCGQCRWRTRPSKISC